jgi:hypothetical protein
MPIITEAFNTQATGALELLLQQEISLLRNHVQVQTMQGSDSTVINQIGDVTATVLTGRHQDTVWGNIDHYVRHAHPGTYQGTALLSTIDELKTMTRPTSAYMKAIAGGIGVATDKEIIRAALQPAMTGREGTTAVALPATQKIANGSTGLTLTKLRQAMVRFRRAKVNTKKTKLYIVVDPEQIDNMLGTVETTSADFNQIRALIAGDLDYFMGFHFVQTTELTKSARIRNCFAYAEGALVLGDWEQVVFTADRLPTVNNEIGVIGRQTLGATRTQEKKVIQIDCQETTA